jgi:hypothetical protein
VLEVVDELDLAGLYSACPTTVMLRRREPGWDVGAPSSRVGLRRATVERITYTPVWVRHPDYVVVRAARSERASWSRTVAVVGRARRVWPLP